MESALSSGTWRPTSECGVAGATRVVAPSGWRASPRIRREVVSRCWAARSAGSAASVATSRITGILMSVSPAQLFAQLHYDVFRGATFQSQHGAVLGPDLDVGITHSRHDGVRQIRRGDELSGKGLTAVQRNANVRIRLEHDRVRMDLRDDDDGDRARIGRGRQRRGAGVVLLTRDWRSGPDQRAERAGKRE